MLWSPRSATREQCTCCSEDLVQPKKKKKKTVYYAHTSQEKEYMSHDGGGTGDAPGSAVRQKERGAVGEGLYCGFCKKGGAG